MNAMIMQNLLVFISGLLAGTFVNLCIYKIPRKEPVLFTTLNCDGCGKRYRLLCLAPVISYIKYGGRCCYCNKIIPWNRSAVEILTGIVFVLLFHRYGWGIEFIAFSYLMLLLVTVVFIDIRHRIIPNGIVIAGLAGGIVVFIYNLFIPFPYYGDGSWWQPLAGMLPGSLFLFLMMLAGSLIYKSDDVLGMGDVKIFAPIGMFLGWRMCIVALVLSIFAGGAGGIILMISGNKRGKDTIPFGPYIALGTILTIVAGWDVLYWYLGK
jgi:leader peptidase (prepilin peptidase)/N-methyltransferase